MPKYRFKEEYRDTVISIPALRLNITRFNLTDELAEKVLKKFPGLAHNLELVPKGGAAKAEHDEHGAGEVKGVHLKPREEFMEPLNEAEQVADQEIMEEDIVQEAGGDMEYPAEEEVKPEPKKKVKKPKAKGSIKKGSNKKDK